jgi:hypothetical protein
MHQPVTDAVEVCAQTVNSQRGRAMACQKGSPLDRHKLPSGRRSDGKTAGNANGSRPAIKPEERNAYESDGNPYKTKAE